MSELFWQGPSLLKEPLPRRLGGHPCKDRLRVCEDIESRAWTIQVRGTGLHPLPQAPPYDEIAGTCWNGPGRPHRTPAARTFPGWIGTRHADRPWLQPQATMPAMFTDNEQEQSQPYAVTEVSPSLGGTPRSAGRQAILLE